MTRTWHGLETGSVERLEVVVDAAVTARSTVIDGDERYEYEVRLGPDWVFRSLRVDAGRSGQLVLDRDEHGTWTHDGEPRPDLLEAVDIDLTFSPFTNTLPLRRLGLAVGASAEILVAYVEAPSLTVRTGPQRYTRLADDRYLFEALDGDFAREITVDADGFVVDYPGLFRLVDHSAAPG